MKKIELMKHLESHPNDPFSKYIQIYLVSEAAKTLEDGSEVSAEDFAIQIQSEYANKRTKMIFSGNYLENSQDPFWRDFINSGAKLILNGISGELVSRLNQYEHVNFDDLYEKIVATNRKANPPRSKKVSEFWECMILTGNSAGIDAAIKDDNLAEHVKSKYKFDPLELALNSGSAAQLDYLIQKFPTLLANIRPDRWTVFHEAVNTMQLDMVKCLLTHGVPVDILSGRGETPLAALLDNHHTDDDESRINQCLAVAECLLQSGANPNIDTVSYHGNTAVLTLGYLPLLLKYGLDPNTNQIDRFSHAAGNDWYDPLKTLFDYGLQVTQTDLDKLNNNYRKNGMNLRYDYRNLVPGNNDDRLARDSSYWYCVGYVTNKIEHFIYAAGMGASEGFLHAANLLMKTSDMLANEELEKISEWTTSAFEADVLNECDDIVYDELLKLAQQLQAKTILPELTNNCLRAVFPKLSPDLLLTQEGYSAAVDLLQTNQSHPALSYLSTEQLDELIANYRRMAIEPRDKHLEYAKPFQAAVAEYHRLVAVIDAEEREARRKQYEADSNRLFAASSVSRREPSRKKENPEQVGGCRLI